MRLIHSALGVTTEAGELADVIKKHIFYKKPLDIVSLSEEIGDVMWYIALLCDELDLDFESILKANIEKLKTRNPTKFTERDAITRDLSKERQILESHFTDIPTHLQYVNDLLASGLGFSKKDFDFLNGIQNQLGKSHPLSKHQTEWLQDIMAQYEEYLY
jgi:NTP pyrophosphatase (non-canonical NTP hydrolase)